MNKKLSTVLSLVMLASMLLAACTTATTAPTTAPTNTTGPAVQATNTTAPTTAPTAAPTTAPTNTTAPSPTPAPHLGAWLDQIVFTKIADNNTGDAQVQAGAIDMWLSSTNSSATLYKTVSADPNLTSPLQYGSSDQILFNTVDCTSLGLLNPFNDMKIREAMNWAVDRNYIVQQIQSGLGVQMYTALDPGFPDAARNAAALGAIATKYAFNMDKAKAVVNAEMPTLGATQDASGKWQYKGKPVTVIGLIRVEDQRKQLGEYFANQLETLGFTVDRQEKTSHDASPIWYSGDPKTCKFNYYTAGWINTSINRDEGLNFDEFNSGDLTQIPVMMAYQPSAQLAKLDKDLYTENFSTLAEREQMFTQALNLSMQESWWGIWVLAPNSFEPYTNKLTVASDLAAGESNPLLGYTLRFKNQTGGTARVAQTDLMTDPWNPINGSNWTWDATVEYTTSDFGVVPDPYTGLYLPKLITSAAVVAKTGLPVAKSLDWLTLTTQDSITVPDDAWADWDAAKQVFITSKDRAAADNTYKQTANEQVTVTYSPDLFKTKWHDGSTFSVADIVMDMIMTFDQGKKESKIYDDGQVPILQTFMSHFKGVKIVSTDPLTITTWDDGYNLDAESSVAAWTWYPSLKEAYPYGTAAWDNLTLALQGEADGKIAMSASKSNTLKVDQTGEVAGPTLAIQASYLASDISSGYIPYAPTLGKYITAADATARFTNLQAWFTAHNNLWLGTGPYYIDKVDPTAGSITVTAFKDYLFADDQFTTFIAPEIATVSVDGPTQVAAGTAAAFTVNVTFNGQPYPSKDIDKVSYTLFGSDGTVAASGSATFTAEGQYTINLTTDDTNKLPAGAASMSVAVASKVVGMPTFVTYQFVVTK
jgi:peptide/nickel transport system substrate-binding protein